MAKEYTNIYQFISEPVKALIQAELMAAETTAKFIQNFGFTNQDTSDVEYGELKSITFTYKRPEDGKQVAVKVPILSLIPIPYMQITDAEFEFNLDLVHTFAQKGELDETKNFDQSSKDLLAMTGFHNSTKSNFKASIAEESSERTKKLKVKIKAAQSDIPSGMLKMLNIMDSGIYVAPVGKLSITLNDGNELVFTDYKTELSLNLNFKNSNNAPVEGLTISKENIKIQIGNHRIYEFKLKKKGVQNESDKKGNLPIRLSIKLSEDADKVINKFPDLETKIAISILIDDNETKSVISIPTRSVSEYVDDN